MTLPAAIFVLGVLTGPPHISARRTAEKPTIDGKLDDPAWRQAPATSAFTQKFPNEGTPPTDPTTVRVLYDDEAVYIAKSQGRNRVIARAA